ncbi:E3 ubiquitin-protein ligase TRAIP-like [Belonocnema kinseyi]|uniref:E3 ubiquitin-protein ligase TRAIP-like n=1 Tax=Belonocnema kinseyi TaxID=2817044 RepID=UPI00143D22B4|nr:E3 ubiquitin-protein ligase TRAIP-like [Belonocnema kinseyi]
MNIVCVICRELLLPSEDIFNTPCGHIFHFPCLTRWLERSKSCPQCREKVSAAKIHRIYFNFSNNEGIEEDSTTLQSRVESLEFKLLLKEKDLSHYVSKAETLDKQVRGLRKEVMKLENEKESFNTTIYALQEQAKYLKEQSVSAESKVKELEKLRKKIELYHNVQTLVSCAVDDVNEMVRETRDPQTLITYIGVMKQELSNHVNKRKAMRQRTMKLEQALSSVTKERDLLSEELLRKKSLEERLAISESIRMELEKRFEASEEKELAPEKSEDPVPVPKISVSKAREVPKVEMVRRVRDSDDDGPVPKKKKATPEQYFLGSPIVLSEDSSDEGAIMKPKNKTKENEENSPYLRVKSKGITALKELHAQRSAGVIGHSIFGKKKRISHLSSGQSGLGPMSFDGFGGHSKPELFPVASKVKKPAVNDAVKAKKPKLDDNAKLADFLINLT